MKAIYALGLFIAASAHAFVPTALHCKEVGTGIDHGYEAMFTTKMDKVSISEQWFRGPQNVAVLKCQAEDVIVNCYEPTLTDGGYSFQMYVNDKGVRVATLNAINRAGTTKIADLVCRYLNPGQ